MFQLLRLVLKRALEPITAQRVVEEPTQSQSLRQDIKEMVYGSMTIMVLPVLSELIIKTVLYVGLR